MSEAGVDIRQLFRMMEEADETGRCWCGKQVGHAGWMDCLFGELRVHRADHPHTEDVADGA